MRDEKQMKAQCWQRASGPSRLFLTGRCSRLGLLLAAALVLLVAGWGRRCWHRRHSVSEVEVMTVRKRMCPFFPNGSAPPRVW